MTSYGNSGGVPARAGGSSNPPITEGPCMAVDDLRPDYANNMRLVGYSDQGGRPDGVQIMLHRGYAYIGHIFSKGFSVVDIRNPADPRPVNYVAAPYNTWSLHLQTADDLLLVIHNKDMFAQADMSDPTTDIKEKSLLGNGSINKVTFGLGYNISPQLSAGINIDSNFGSITTNSTSRFNNIQYATREFNESVASGLGFSVGLMYNSKLKSKTQFAAGLTITPSTNLNFKNQRIFYREESEQFNGEIADALNTNAEDSSIKLPSKFSIGLAVGQNKKWQVGAEIVYQNFSSFGNRFNDISNSSYENSNVFKFGGYYIPKYNSFTNYFDRVTYRAGFNYQNTGLIVNGKSINEQNISFGFGLPLGGSISNLNIGFELGKRGTKLGGLVIETYQNLIIGLSLNDKWFSKRKFD